MKYEATTSKKLASLIGPTLMALAVTEALNLHIWKASFPALVYLDGTLLFIAGLSIIRIHNLWARMWPILITLVGWLALGMGLYRMVAPEAQQLGKSTITYILLGLLFICGSILTFKGYTADNDIRSIERVD
jgi:uncharacterized membrane protein HdeD (DUF308 family)